MGWRTCFRCTQSCIQASAGSSHRCRWARQSGRTRESTAGCRCRQWRCPPCWAPWPGWNLSGSGSFPPAGGSCADGYCGDHFPTVHSYKNTYQRQETNIKSYLVSLASYEEERGSTICSTYELKVKESFLPVFKDECCDQGCNNHNERHSDCDYLVNCQTCKDRETQTQWAGKYSFHRAMHFVFCNVKKKR